MIAGLHHIRAKAPGGDWRVIQEHQTPGARDVAFAALSRGPGWEYDTADLAPCRCKCGYTCGWACDLDFDRCMDLHYVRDCQHRFNGPGIDIGNGWSVTCSRCGMSAIGHDFVSGP